jgi:3',5'-cyclic AMP phosphodiesterase CpdA
MRRDHLAVFPAFRMRMAENLVHIGEVVVHGVLFDPKNGDALRNMDLDGLYKSVPRLFELLDQRAVDYVLVGGIAMLAYIEGRNTQDIDLIVASGDLAKLPEITIDDRNPEFARGHFGDLRVDFLFSDGQLFDLVRREYTTTKRFVERDVRCATVEGLLLLKMFALPSVYRQGNFAKVRTYEKDIADLVDRDRVPIEPMLSVLSKYMLASDLNEVRKIAGDIQHRIAREADRFQTPSQ